MFAQQTSIYLAILASLAVRQVAAHGYCVKFGVADVSTEVTRLGSRCSLSACRNVCQKTYAGFDPTWAEGPSILGPTPQRPTDNVNTGEFRSLSAAELALT
jgi:hypothetical protein